MQILQGIKQEIIMKLWNEQLEKAKAKMARSEECYRRFNDEDSKKWIDEDRAKVAEIEEKIAQVAKYMGEHEDAK